METNRQQKLPLNSIKAFYVNRAAHFMENYFSDLIIDLPCIEAMKKGETLYFIVQPNCTHIANKKNYDDTRDVCARVWGNYVVFRIDMIDTDQYTIRNWDILDKSSYDTKSQELIGRYKEFVLS